jgi:hypothetical protein
LIIVGDLGAYGVLVKEGIVCVVVGFLEVCWFVWFVCVCRIG